MRNNTFMPPVQVRYETTLHCDTSKLFSTHLSAGRFRKFDKFFSSRVTDRVLYNRRRPLRITAMWVATAEIVLRGQRSRSQKGQMHISGWKITNLRPSFNIYFDWDFTEICNKQSPSNWELLKRFLEIRGKNVKVTARLNALLRRRLTSANI